MDSNRLWIEENRLTTKHLKIMQERANKIKVPSDIGRIPNKIATGDGFSRFTADQWKTSILIYATTITWDLLKDEDRKYYLILYEHVISLYVIYFQFGTK